MNVDACLLAKGASFAIAGATAWPIGRVVVQRGAGAGETNERGRHILDYNVASSFDAAAEAQEHR